MAPQSMICIMWDLKNICSICQSTNFIKLNILIKLRHEDLFCQIMIESGSDPPVVHVLSAGDAASFIV